MSRITPYPHLELETGIRMHLAHTWRARLLGLAGMTRLDPDEALVIPHCTSVHTFGMRFPIDVVFVDREWLPIYIEYEVGPRRVLRSRFARSVIELVASRAVCRTLPTSARRRRLARTGSTSTQRPRSKWRLVE